MADDKTVRSFLLQVARSPVDEIRRALAGSPELANAVGPHPFWGGRPQALHVAVENKRRDVFELLLEAGADPAGTNDRYDHWSPLMIAIHGGQDAMRDRLIPLGAPVGLPEALLLGDDARVEELLRPGRPALPQNVPNGGSLLNFARTPFAIDRLIELGVPLELPNRWGVTPVQSLSRLGPSAQAHVKQLIAHGAQATPDVYARLDDREALALLLNADPGLAASESLFMAAVESGHTALVEWLLTRGANVNSRADGQSRQTALHAAAWNGDLPMVRLLVESGADISARDEEHDSTPRQWAATAIRIRNDSRPQQAVDYLAGRGAGADE